ncbi:acyltransferase family protein [Bifidobacterium choerinum]|nr:acyltransferase [Bifidobacterium choerinum]
MTTHGKLQPTKIRNSNVEVVRLIAMVMIVLNHAPWNALHYVDVDAGYVQRLGPTLFVSFLSNWGGVGDCLFFVISAWFLCDERQSYRKNLSRCWHLEKQLWFWSVVLFAGCLTIWHMRGTTPEGKPLAALGLKTIFPFAANMWWYPTSYMLFLLVCPLLTRGLRALPRARHAALCVGLLLMFGWTPASIFPLNMIYSIVLFVYLYILMCYVKWHMPDFVANKGIGYRLLIFGLILGLGSQLIVQCIMPNRAIWTVWMNSPRCISSICVALGIVVLATTARPRHSRSVNYVAASTLAVYLVCTHPCAALVLVPLVATEPSGFVGVTKLVGLALLVYLVALMLDMLRHWMFGWSIDRNVQPQNAWIAATAEKLLDRGVSLLDRLGVVSSQSDVSSAAR